jgi:hypothetical protein
MKDLNFIAIAISIINEDGKTMDPPQLRFEIKSSSFGYNIVEYSLLFFKKLEFVF